MGDHRTFDEMARHRTRLAQVEALLADALAAPVVEFDEIAELRAGRTAIRAQITALEAELAV